MYKFCILNPPPSQMKICLHTYIFCTLTHHLYILIGRIFSEYFSYLQNIIPTAYSQQALPFVDFLNCRFMPTTPNVSDTVGHFSCSVLTQISQGSRKLLPGKNPGRSTPAKERSNCLFISTTVRVRNMEDKTKQLLTNYKHLLTGV